MGVGAVGPGVGVAGPGVGVGAAGAGVGVAGPGVGVGVGVALQAGSTAAALLLTARMASSETDDSVPAWKPVGSTPIAFQSEGRLEYGVPAKSHCIFISSTLAPKVPL